MKTIADVLTWVVVAVIVGLLSLVVVLAYANQKECEERGGVLLRKAVGAVCVKVEQI